MSKEGTGSFDIQQVRDLAELMIEHDLAEVDLRKHGETIRLRRGVEGTPQVVAPPMVAATPTAPATAVSSDGDQADSDLTIIKSPMVGTFYSRPNPDSPSFVKVGQDVAADTTICIIEAMKVFNEIAAEVSGTIVSILVEDEEAVEFGKPLMKVRPHK